jgi:hypothetical protein
MFELKRNYTREQIHALVRGNLQSYLPNVDGRVVAACLRLDMDPDAPRVILVGEGEGIVRAAALLRGQREPVPTFLKRGTREWEYVGEFVAQRCSIDSDEIATQSQRSGRCDITMVIHMIPAATLTGSGA